MKQTLRYGAQVQTRSAHQNRESAAVPNVFEHAAGFTLVIAGGEDFGGFANIDHVMRYASAFLDGAFRSMQIAYVPD